MHSTQKKVFCSIKDAKIASIQYFVPTQASHLKRTKKQKTQLENERKKQTSQ